ncbi:hypothetical protein [Nitrobacter sp.]|uniref:hypothetical protein n=1 Tax=Nitrobacter sp. TaxID=29420 RepID=UPI00399D7019
MTVLPFKSVAHELFTLAFGHHPRAATEDQIRGALKMAAGEASLTSFTPRFLATEWLHVVDAWQLDSLEAYHGVPRRTTRIILGPCRRFAPARSTPADSLLRFAHPALGEGQGCISQCNS